MSAETLLAAADYLEGTAELWKSGMSYEEGQQLSSDCTCTGLALMKFQPDTEDALALLLAIGLTPLELPKHDPSPEEAKFISTVTGDDPSETLERLVLEERVWPVIFDWNDREETTLQEAVSALRRAAEIRA